MRFDVPRRNRSWINFLLLVLSLFVTELGLAAQNLLTAAQWHQDLIYLAEQIPKTNPRAFHHMTRQQFESAVAEIDARIPTLSDHQIELELVRLVAMLGEGHSRVSLPGLVDPMSDVSELTAFKDQHLAFHRLPIKLHWFPDGFFVIDSTKEFQSLIGTRVVQIGGRPTEEVADAVSPYINRDNDMGLRLIAPELLVVSEVLESVHVVAQGSGVPVIVRTPSGKDELKVLPVLPAGIAPQWVSLSEGPHDGRATPQRPPYKSFRLEYLDTSHTLWLRIHVIQDSPSESVAKVARKINSITAQQVIDRFVIDLRDCHGGDNTKFRPLLLQIIRDPRLNQAGRTFTIIDRGTFSAAVNASSDLERLSNTLFVGEPTAGAPSSWGDPKKIVLPNSGLIARISTVYWRDWTTDETRPWIAPDLPVEISSNDYFRGRDSAMERILQFGGSTAFGDILQAAVRNGGGLDTILRLYYQRKTDPLWADESTRQPMYEIGKLLMARRSYNEALLVFQINARDYPDSLQDAIEAVRSTAQTATENQDVNNLLLKLESMRRTRN